MADRVISYVFRGSFTGLTAGLTAAGRSVNDLGGRMTALDRNGERMRRGLSTVGDAAGKMGLVAAAGLGAIVTVTAKFEKSMSAVSAATNASAADLEKLRAAAISAGADTVFSAGEAADGITELGKAGLSTSDILSGGLTGALNLAAAGQIGVADAAATTAITLSQFGLAGDQASRVADTLAAGAGKALGSVEDMSEALKYVGPVASQMGLSLEDVSGVIAELASQGILGSQAGTSLRGMLTALTSPSKQAKLTMEGLGISMYDAQGKFVGLEGIAGQLHDTMSGLTNAERDQALGRIFGNEQVTTARILYAGGASDVQKWTDQVTDSGYAADQAAKLTDNLSGDLEAFKGSLETALIGAGEGSQGALRGLVQNATSVVNAFNKLPPSAQGAASGILAVAAATGGGLFLGAKVVGGIADTRRALADLGTTGQRAGTLLKGLGVAGGVAVGLLALGAAAESIEEKFDKALPSTEALTKSILDLGSAQSAQQLAEQVGSLSHALDTLDSSGIQGLRDNLDSTANSGGILGTALKGASIAGSGFGLGGLVDPANARQLREAADAIGAVDSAMANIAATGGPEAASAAFANLAAAQHLSADEQKALLAQLPLYSDALDAASNSATLAAQASTDAAGAAGAAGDATFQTAEEVADAAKQLDDARKAAEDAARGFVNLGKSVNDADVSLDDWIKQLEKQNQALRNFQRNAVKAADNGLRGGLIRALQDLGPEGALRLGQLANASDREVARANRAFGKGEKFVESYADSITAVPTSKTTTLTVQNQGADATIARIKAQLASIPKSVRTDYYVNQVNAANKRAANKATGGYIAGPGTGTSDSIPARLSNGEYVIKASSVARYGVAMFDSLNAQRFAKGGEVKGKSARPRPGIIVSGDVEGDSRKGILRGLNRELGDLKRQVNAATASVDANKEAVDRETSARDNLQGQFDSLSSSISGMFSSDLFGDSGGAFSGSAKGDPISVLLGDIANSQQFQSLFAGLQGAGLSGGALTAAAQGGIAGLQTVSAYTPEQIAQFQQLFDIREQQGTQTGQQVAQAQFGQSLDLANQKADQANALLAQSNALLAALNDKTQATTHEVKQVTDATKTLTSSAHKGQRNKPRGRR